MPSPERWLRASRIQRSPKSRAKDGRQETERWPSGRAGAVAMTLNVSLRQRAPAHGSAGRDTTKSQESRQGWQAGNGEVAEWFKAAVLKTVDPKGSGGSNPSLSAIYPRSGKMAIHNHENRRFDEIRRERIRYGKAFGRRARVYPVNAVSVSPVLRSSTFFA
jgi:hypothetical protein